MTEREAFELFGKGPTWISFYYNRIDYGRLVKNPNGNEWFFIPKKANHNGTLPKNWDDDLPEFFEPVDLEMIEEVDGPFEPMQDYDSFVVTSDYDETILIVLGAGASFDFNDGSLPDRVKLPLTKDIFSDEFSGIRNRYHGAQSLYNSLVDINDLEAFFQRKWNLLSRSYNPQLMRDLISCQYYMQELFLQLSILTSTITPNFYTSLVQQMRDYYALRRKRVKFLVVSFNYDTLFEQQLEKILGYRFYSLESYDDPDHSIYLYKLHGSCDWCRYFKEIERGKEWISSHSLVNHSLKDLSNLTNLTRLLEPNINILTEAKKRSFDEREIRRNELALASVRNNTKMNNEFFLSSFMTSGKSGNRDPFFPVQIDPSFSPLYFGIKLASKNEWQS